MRGRREQEEEGRNEKKERQIAKTDIFASHRITSTGNR
jgi:hypothetical protein